MEEFNLVSEEQQQNNDDDDNENCQNGLFFEDENDDDFCFVDGIQDVTFINNNNSSSFSSSQSPCCQVITRESLLLAQKAVLQRVMDLLMVKEHHARTLLIHYQWNVDRLLTIFIEKGKAHLFAEAGVTVIEIDALSSVPSLTFMCYICMEDVLFNEATLMDCGHKFCNNCWTEHFVVRINDGESKRIKCMEHKCNSICDEAVVRILVRKKNPELAEKFDRILLESYIEDNKMIKWCPSIPHCGNAIRIEDDSFCEVECTCGLQFCFRCLSEPHSPSSCLMWEQWGKKCNDSKTFRWISVHTKSCPSCGKFVEKNGGCNIVHCICGSAFCWRCGKSYVFFDHIHNCTRYQPPAGVELAKKNSHRYRHYYSLYKGHRDSMKLEAMIEQKIKYQASNIQVNTPELQDFSWVKNGVHRLFRSRHILSYSYVFSYYMFGDELFQCEMTEAERITKQHLFEDQQQQLEARVETLSGLMEKPFHKYSIDRVRNIKMQVISLTKAVDDLCRKMYDCIENDLLGSLQLNTLVISPYEPEGVVRASELPKIHKYMGLDHSINGCLMENGEPSSSKDTSDGQEPPEKRAKIRESSSCFDLGLSSNGVMSNAELFNFRKE